MDVLKANLDAPPLILQGLASDLYELIAVASAENASRSFLDRRRISSTEVERRFFERLEAEDPTLIGQALTSGAIEPVDFATPVNDPGFYQGVKVKPGHIAAELVVARRADTAEVLKSLRHQRSVLVVGPSGAGKSALTWLSAYALDGEMQWFSVTGLATSADVAAIVRFVRARKPTDKSPVGIAFDDIGPLNVDVWNALVHELRALPGTHFLGSVREEDETLIRDRSETDFIRVQLDDALAQTVWKILSSRGETDWQHWYEPFEQSQGLMLEYVHILTQGNRLAAIVDDQVRQRTHEARYDELAIIRATAVIATHGGHIDAPTLLSLLDLGQDAGYEALTRLIDEHLVAESQPGVLGGLHPLRSQALLQASHDGAAYAAHDTLWRFLAATTRASLPRVVRSILLNVTPEEEGSVLTRLSAILDGSGDVELWAAVLIGLGFATLERHVVSFQSVLRTHRVHPAQWSLAAMFAPAGIEVPDLPDFPHWQRLRQAVHAFRNLPKIDLRRACLERLPQKPAALRCQGLPQLNHLLSCCVPISDGDSLPLPFLADFPRRTEHDLREVAALLSTARVVSPRCANSLVRSLGGQRALFRLFHSQTPWVTFPKIESGPHGTTIRADWFLVTEDHQSDPHDTVCQICVTLAALAPNVDSAACDALDPEGARITVADHQPWSKDIPRANMPPNAAIAWNVAFGHIFRATATTDSLTHYAHEMAELVLKTEAIVQTVTERWIRGKSLAGGAWIERAADVHKTVTSLSFQAPLELPSAMTTPIETAQTSDPLGYLLTAILGNLLVRISDVAKAKSAATFASRLAADASELRESPIWRTVTSPPLRALDTLSSRLRDLADVLHEIAGDPTPGHIQKMCLLARKANIGKATVYAAKRSRLRATRRLEDRLRAMRAAFEREGWVVRCPWRLRHDAGSVYWPDCEIAILPEMRDLKAEWFDFVDNGITIGRKHLQNDWPFVASPVVNGCVLPSLAIHPSSPVPIPDDEFAAKWSAHVHQPFHSSDAERALMEGVARCVEVSSILKCRNKAEMHAEEDRVLSALIADFRRVRTDVTAAAGRAGREEWQWVSDILDRKWAKVKGELNSWEVGRITRDSLCGRHSGAPVGTSNEAMIELAVLRVEILQAECAR